MTRDLPVVSKPNTTAFQINSPPIVRISARSASHDPMRLPRIMPTPNTASTNGTYRTGSPETWVNVGVLRARAVAHFAPYVRDVVVTGHDRDDIGILAVADLDACRALCADLPPTAGAPAVLAHPAVRACVAERLTTFAGLGTGSSTTFARAMLLEEPPSLDALEVTDKGSLNQRAVLARRAALVDELYAPVPSPRVIMVTRCREDA